MVLFPRKGDQLRAHSVFFQASQVRDKDIGITSGMGVSRASGSSVTIAAGYYKYNNAIGSYAGTTLTGVPAAGSGKHRYDIVVFDCSTASAKYIQGSEDIPSPYPGGFLNNLVPSPPEIESEAQIILAVYKVTSAGIPDENQGKYCVRGVANIQVALNDTLGVTGGNSHKTRHQSGGADAIKIDDLAAGDDNTDLNASTTKHGLMQKYPNTAQALKGDGSWITRYFEIDFPFGNGQDVIETGLVQEVGVPVNCRIIYMDIWEVGLVNSSASLNLYMHNLGAAKGSVIWNLYYTNGTSKISEPCDIGVAIHKVLRFEVASITAAKQIVCRLFCEAT
jgi:hypothetical protein